MNDMSVSREPRRDETWPVASAEPRVDDDLCLTSSEAVHHDAAQVITARPSVEEMGGIPHHLYGVIPPDEEYSVARWCDDVIAATPRAWARVSAILRATSERRLRNILVAGTVGEAIGAEFALVADEVAATVRIDELLRTEPGKRLALYPDSMHGLHALVYGLIGALSAATAPGIIACMADLTKLADKRPEPVFRTLPLEELRTHGFELLIQRGLALDLADSFLDSPAYVDYARQREEAGLA